MESIIAGEPDLKRVQEADIMAAAVRIMAKYRGGLMATIAVMEETEQALRRPVVDDPARKVA